MVFEMSSAMMIVLLEGWYSLKPVANGSRTEIVQYLIWMEALLQGARSTQCLLIHHSKDDQLF